MRKPHSPRLALALLQWLVPDSDPLAGDLLEELARGRSRVWLWSQVLAAVARAPFDASSEIRPLRLVELQPADAQERARRFGLRFPAVNLTASPVHGIGGLGMLMLGLQVTIVVPAAWWVLLGSMFAGSVLGLAWILVRRT